MEKGTCPIMNCPGERALNKLAYVDLVILTGALTLTGTFFFSKTTGRTSDCLKSENFGHFAIVLFWKVFLAAK